MSQAYETLANTLEERIFQLIPAHPEIMEMESAWDLLKIKEFKCDDLGPSAAQAGWAFAYARRRYRTMQRESRKAD